MPMGRRLLFYDGPEEYQVDVEMTTINRIAAIMLSILLLASGPAVLASALYLPGPNVFTAYDGQQFTFTPLVATDKVIAGALGLLLFLAGLFLLSAHLLGPPFRQHFPLRATEAGRAVVARQSVEERLATVLERIAGVRRATLRARLSGSAVLIAAQLTADPEVSVPAVCDEAEALINHTLEQDLGLAPGPVSIRVKLAGQRERARSAAKG